MTAIFGPFGPNENSPQSVYRYQLHRTIAEDGGDPSRRSLVFLLLNPSTADATNDDPTIRRCIGYGKRWGFTELKVGNIFAYRSTDPSQLNLCVDPVGPKNNWHLVDMCENAERIVCGWGTGGPAKKVTGWRMTEVVKLLRGHQLWALKVNDNGSPVHPLYQAAEREPFIWIPGRR